MSCSFDRTLWLTIFTYGQTFGVLLRFCPMTTCYICLWIDTECDRTSLLMPDHTECVLCLLVEEHLVGGGVHLFDAN